MEQFNRAKEAVVIGGSAGSIDPLIAILSQLPADFTAAVIVVLHLAPDAQSLLPEIFESKSRLAAKEAESTEPLERGVIYIAPPNYHLSVEPDLTLALSNEEPRSYSRPSIDILFESAAEAFRNRVVGVLLSGANADGAEGLKNIHAHKGITIVQDPKTSAFPDMPQAALNLFEPNYTMTPEKIGQVLAQSFKSEVVTRNLGE